MLLRALVAIVILLAVGVACSADRRGIDWRFVAKAFVMQALIGLLVLWSPPGAAVLHRLSDAVEWVLSFGGQGSAFLFGGLVGPRMNDIFGGGAFVFALRVLPQIVYVAALLALLEHYGVLRFLARVIGGIVAKILGTTPMEGFSAVLTIFLGQTEMPVALQHTLDRLPKRVLATVLCSGTASVAGSVLAGYASLGVPMTNLLAASVMAIPGGLLFSRILFPGEREDAAALENMSKRHNTVFEALADGAMNGARIAVAVGAVLVAFVGLIALVDGILGNAGLTLTRILGVLLSPVVWLMGVPWSEAVTAGGLLGQKIVFNEFVAYASLSPLIHGHLLSLHTITILSFALCGFANLSTIGILIGAFGSAAPARRGDVAALAGRAVIAGTLSNAMSAVIAGLLV
ncbi:NupC/NupG family nucleoside CNT transporter [Neokomagataea tanensis]|uniref:NupC/NupG family nucleoside CNT transporter n=1 Tax=Neokomagataea tanensis TaxID=661191 RepID=A0A4Y6V9B6_9PROT|nr:NupC/NupG family nucleoside CNT transporter [Neokomagataea tanensis]